MRKLIVFLLLLFCGFWSFGAHIKGGFFTYEYLGPGINDPAKLRYKITLTLYSSYNPSVGPPPGNQIFNVINFTIFQGNTPTQTALVSVNLTRRSDLIKTFASPCITGINLTGPYYSVFEYELNNYELPVSPDGYTVSYQKCCRLNNMDNVINSGGVGDTWSIHIPGSTNPIINGDHNSSPVFPVNDTLLVCANNPFTYPFGATDPDGDELSYVFCSAYPGGSNTDVNPDPSSPPPYSSIPYSPPYSGSQPMGSQVTVNPQTGLISGIAPPINNTGEYVITVCVNETRNGVFFAQTKKELHVRVRDCQPLKAILDPEYFFCGDFTAGFDNNKGSNPGGMQYLWIFGDPTTGSSDTSTLATPIHTYSDTGVFLLKLKITLNGVCIDSAFSSVKVYPGFFPGFIWSGLCTGKPIQFTDTTKTNYGTVNKWRWEFGNPNTLADTSHLQNPSYTYPLAGSYDVNFIVSNSKGCIDTVTKSVPVIDNPTITNLFKDTSYCGKDTIQLHSSSTIAGNFSWTPSVNIIGANTADPFVFPTVTTTYRVTLDASGCIGTDSVIVRPKLDLTTNVNASPANICEEDTLTLTATANHTPVQFLWSPSVSVVSPTSAITKAFPKINTTYTVFATWGNNCIAANNKTITVKPLAVPNAGPDAAFCPGTNGVNLSASGGDNYTWTPSRGLSAANISNPLARPDTTTTYIVSVGVSGCTKRREDSIVVTVRPLPALTVTNDTLMCAVVDTMQLNATGSGSIFWTPNYIINNQNSTSPLVSPRVTTKYYATITDALGCINIDSVIVNVKDSVTLNAGNDTSICRTDAITLKPVSDALHYLWSPGQPVLNSDTAKYPIATPLSTTTFMVIGNIGKCQSKGFVTVKVAPYPIANAGGDTTICFGDMAQLNAAGGSIYKWSPTYFLNNPNIFNPVSNTSQSIKYVVTVSDTSGCPKGVTDTVLITVYPKIIADAGPRDTTVVVNQPLQLKATGGQFYLWSPSSNLNNPNIYNPVAIFRSVTDATNNYVVTVSTATCSATDTITVHVYKVDPGLYVPNAFTPNGDGNNDVFRPIPIGMKNILYFQVFNRWGQLMFSTSEQMKGWDGTYKGKPQDAAAYVWIVEGIDYQGGRIKQKGSVVLIR